MNTQETDLERISRAQEAGRVGSWTLDVDTGRMWWCERTRILHGLREGSREGALDDLLERVHQDDRAVLAGKFASLATADVLECSSYRVHAKDGSARVMLVRGGAKTAGQTGRRAWGVTIDITPCAGWFGDQESHRRLLLECEKIGRVGSFRVRVSALGHPDKPVFWSDGMYRLLGYESGEFVPTVAGVLAHVLEQDYAATQAQIARVVETRSSYDTHTFRVRHVDGRARLVRGHIAYVEDAVQEPELMGVLQDVTEVPDGAAFTAALLESVEDGVIGIDERGIVTVANAGVERLFGWCPSELVGKNVGVLMPPTIARHHNQHLANYRATGERTVPWTGREVVAMRKDGTTFLADLSVAEYRLGDERRFAGIIRDISERRRIEMLAHETEVRVRTAVAFDLHDSVNQDLSGARILIQSLVNDAPPSLADRLKEVAELLKQSIDSVRNASRSLSDSPHADAPLVDTLRQMSGSAGAAHGFRVTFTVPESFEDPPRRQKVQVVSIAREALLNAFRHSKGRNIQIALEQDSSSCVLSVADDGRGFDHAVPPPGGLGLHSLKYRARVLGGKVSVEAAQPQGTRVVVKWPRSVPTV